MNLHPVLNLNELFQDHKESIPAIVQEIVSGEVVRLVHMNKNSLDKIMDTGDLWNYEQNGNIQEIPYRVIDMKWNDIDQAILIKVERKSITTQSNYGFNQAILEESFQKNVLSKIAILTELYEVIMQRKKLKPEQSYVARKMSEGVDRILKKVGEEAGEVIIAGKNADIDEICLESADLIFHLWLLLGFYDISPNNVYDKLIERRK